MSDTTRTKAPRRTPAPGGDPTERSPRPSRATRWPTRPLNTRSLVGAGLVVIAVGGVLSAHRAAVAPPATSIVVAARPLVSGTTLGAADLTAVPAEIAGAATTVSGDDLGDLVGRTLARSVEPGAVLTPADVGAGTSTTPPGSMVASVEVPAGRTPSGVRPGVVVDVFATDDDRNTTDLVVRGALVVGAPDPTADPQGSSIGASLGGRIDLALADRTAAAALVDASVRHQLSLVLPTPGGDRG